MMALLFCAGASWSLLWSPQQQPCRPLGVPRGLHYRPSSPPCRTLFPPNFFPIPALSYRMNSLSAFFLPLPKYGSLHSKKSENPQQLLLAARSWLSGNSSLMYMSRTPKLAHRRLKIRVLETSKVLHVTRASLSSPNTSLGEKEDGAPDSQPAVDFQKQAQNSPLLAGWQPPRYVWRSVACVIIAGQIIVRVTKGKIHFRNSMQQLSSVGPGSLGVSLLTASFVGMVFTIQFVREFARLGLTRSVGGVLALALARELSPVVTAIILAGRVGSAFAAELGTMQVSEQTDTLRVLRTDPIDYLVTPRVLACCISLPILTIICFTVGMAASVLLADSVYHVSSNIILDSAAKALQPWDLISSSIKAVVFGAIISIVSCAWGLTTAGGAKGVGESTTSAVVISLVCIFIADFILSWCFFQGAGDALKAAMG